MVALREGIQTSQERVRTTRTLTGPVTTYPLLGSENPSHLPPGGLANPGADPRSGFLEERGRESRKTREGLGRERDGAAPKTPARVYGPGSQWPALVGWAHREGQGGVCLGLEVRARGLRSGARVTCEEGRKSPKRGACCELGVLGAPRAAGARAPGRAGDAAGTGSQTEGAAAGVGGTATEKDTAGRFAGRDWAGAGIRAQRRGPQPRGRRGGTETQRRGPCCRLEVALELGDPSERVAGLWVTAGGGASWAPGPRNLSPGFTMLPPGQRPALGAGQR